MGWHKNQALFISFFPSFFFFLFLVWIWCKAAEAEKPQTAIGQLSLKNTHIHTRTPSWFHLSFSTNLLWVSPRVTVLRSEQWKSPKIKNTGATSASRWTQSRSLFNPGGAQMLLVKKDFLPLLLLLFFCFCFFSRRCFSVWAWPGTLMIYFHQWAYGWIVAA